MRENFTAAVRLKVGFLWFSSQKLRGTICAHSNLTPAGGTLSASVGMSEYESGVTSRACSAPTSLSARTDVPHGLSIFTGSSANGSPPRSGCQEIPGVAETDSPRLTE
jgi:hypothetical protein